MDRSHSGAGAQGGYRAGYRPNYRQPEHSYGNYDPARKYDSGKFDRQDQVSSTGGMYPSAGRTYPNGMAKESYSATTSGGGSPTTPKETGTPSGQKELTATSLEKKITNMQEEMTQALQENTVKENEKFDLIFSILIELQRRQGQLEESVKSLKVQLDGGSGSTANTNGNSGNALQQSGSPQGQPQHAAQQGQMGQQMGFMGGQMPMGQQFANMVATDGSGGFFTPVVVAVPNTSFGMPMMQATQMQPMQQMVQFVAPGQGDEYQWGMTGAGNNGTGGNASTGCQRTDSGGQQTTVQEGVPSEGFKTEGQDEE